MLNKFVKVRKEGNRYFLHHSINGGLIKIEPKLFQLLNGNQQQILPSGVKAKLARMGFLNPYNPSTVANYQGTMRVKRTGFLSLRSEKAPFHVFWEITAKCNLTCLYCFPDMKSKRTICKQQDLDTDNLHKICGQIIDAELFKVTLTGGEALLRNDIWDIIGKLEDAAIMVSVISNGVYFPDTFLEKIKNTNVLVAISLDAPNENTNRITRGPNAFEKTVKTIQRLIENQIRTSAIITLTKHNFHCLDQTVEILRNNDVKYVAIQDLKPFGTKEIYDATRLTPSQEAELPERISRLEEKYPDIGFMFTELFIFGEPAKNTPSSGKLMDCPAGEHFGYIDYHGNFYPCNILRSFNMGNLLEHSLTDMWQNSGAIKNLRRIKNLPLNVIEKCSTCPRQRICHGGCRGDALFYDGHLMGIPSRCPERHPDTMLHSGQTEENHELLVCV